MARVDFLMEAATGKFYINEPNTMPGLYVHQHVSEDVGSGGCAVLRA